MSGVIYVVNSQNSKLSNANNKIDATYSAIKNTCPSTCSLKNSSCYAQQSYVGIINSRLEKSARKLTALKVARSEAKAIDNSYGGNDVPQNTDLRLHISGDSSLVKGTRLIASSINRWLKRGGRVAYTYTHAWANVHRNNWKNVSVLASVSNIKEAKLARKQGYAPSIIVPEHKTNKSFKIKGSPISWIPCPAQTKDNVVCSTCRLCMRGDWLFKNNKGISFAAHGINKNALKRRLQVIQ